MRFVIRLGVVLVFVLFCLSSSFADVLDEIRKSQKDVRTIKAKFAQEKLTELLDRPIKSQGTFYFKSPVGVRWEYEGSMVVIYDGESLYLHYIELDEAEKVYGVAGFSGPLSFDIDALLRDYEVASEEKEGRYLLKMKPKKQMPFETMEMSFSPGAAFPGEVRITEETGDLTVIKFHDIKTNIKIPDRMFVFTPPPGVRVRERRLEQ